MHGAGDSSGDWGRTSSTINGMAVRFALWFGFLSFSTFKMSPDFVIESQAFQENSFAALKQGSVPAWFMNWTIGYRKLTAVE
jgi:hypothetical protein